MSDLLIELGPEATLLDAADRLAQAPPGRGVALTIPAGAPLARSGPLLAVAHRLAGDRPFAVVAADGRVRAIAASAHVRAYPSVGALERREVAPTEPEVVAEPAARRAAPAGGAGWGRRLAVLAALALALGLVLALAVPSATVTVAPAATPVATAELALRAGPGGDIASQQLTEDVAVRVAGTATGSRTVTTKATGTVRFTNKTTDDIRLPRGTLVLAGATRFLTTEERTLPRSLLVPFLLSTLDIPVEAIDAGDSGNVAAGRVTSNDAARYDATNPQPLAGGGTKVVTFVTQADYDLAARSIPAALDAAAAGRFSAWRSSVRPGNVLAGGAAWSVRQQLPAAQLVGLEVSSFEILVAATVFAFAVPVEEPRTSALVRLRAAVDPGNDVDEASASVDVLATTTDANGVTFRVRASGLQFARSSAAAIAALVAGRAPADAESLLRSRGLRLAALERFPAWWPLLPLLDARISVVERPAR